MEKLQQQSNTEDSIPNQKTQEIHIQDQPISKLYTDDCGRFPIWSRSGNEYIMIAYHCEFNTILQAPFVNRKDKHRIRVYNSIMKKFTVEDIMQIAHSLAILAGVDPDFPKYMWDNLLTQTELTINLLRQATLNPRMSAWEYYNGPFDYSDTPLGTL